MLAHPFMLIADDDEDDIYLMQSAFKETHLSVKVDFVQNGIQVLTYLDQIREDNPFPDLIVLDLNMPMLNGRETLLRLKGDSRYHKIPVAILTTSMSEEEKAHCLQMGAALYLFKSSGFESIVSTAKCLYDFSGPVTER
jgi:CheY-like chemotaxis protein